MPSEKDLTPREDRAADNEIRAALFDAEHGAHTFISPDLPPELREQFLKNVLAVENATEADKRTVRELMGALPIASEPPATDPEAEQRIKTLEEHFRARQLLVLRPRHLSARGYYHFLITDLLDVRVVPPANERQFVTIDYDAVRHDGPQHLVDRSEAFLRAFLTPTEPFPTDLLAPQLRLGPEVVSTERALAHLNEARARWTSVVPRAFAPGDIQAGPNGLFLWFDVAYDATDAAGHTETFEGMGVLQLIFYRGAYRIQGGSFPGFEF